MVRGQSYFHPIPPGYGLPWGTPGERADPGAADLRGSHGAGSRANEDAESRPTDPLKDPTGPSTAPGAVLGGEERSSCRVASAQIPVDTTVPGSTPGPPPPGTPGLPPDWPDPLASRRNHRAIASAGHSIEGSGACDTPRLTTETTPSDRSSCRLTSISAMTCASTDGNRTCSAATTISASAVICTSPKCSRLEVGPEKREWCGGGRPSDKDSRATKSHGLQRFSADCQSAVGHAKGGAPDVPQDINVLALVKGEERYVFCTTTPAVLKPCACWAALPRTRAELYLVRCSRVEPEDPPGKQASRSSRRFHLAMPSRHGRS